MTKKLFPKCVYRVGMSQRAITMSNRGYLFPCCWMDHAEAMKEAPQFLDPELEVKKHDSIESILTSDQWLDHYDMLINRPEEAPPTCYSKCSTPEPTTSNRDKLVGDKVKELLDNPTTHFCMVKFGDKVQGMNADQLVLDICRPVREHCENVKFHLITEKPIENCPDWIHTQIYPKEIFDEHFHWTKTLFFDPSVIGAEKEDQTIVVDIDMKWVDDPTSVIHYPVAKNQFVSMDRWWRDNDMPISGNFYKFNSHDFEELSDIYQRDSEIYRKKYFETGVVAVENHGEQYFVYETIKDLGAEVVLQPADWCMKHHPDKLKLYAERYKEKTGGDYYEDFHGAIWHYFNVRP